jgi:hypothetical protein
MHVVSGVCHARASVTKSLIVEVAQVCAPTMSSHQSGTYLNDATITDECYHSLRGLGLPLTVFAHRQVRRQWWTRAQHERAKGGPVTPSQKVRRQHVAKLCQGGERRREDRTACTAL